MIDAIEPAITSLAARIVPGASLLRVWELKGGISARTIAFELRCPEGTTARCVARCLPTDDDVRNDLPTAGEYRLLQALHRAGVPVPRPLLFERFDAQGRASIIVSEFIDGSFVIDHREVAPLMKEFATQLAAIHRVDWRALALDFLPDRVATWTRRLGPRPAQLDDSLDEGALRDALERVWPLGPRNAPVLLHGDFWPGNVLWKDDQLAAIIDWEDAAIGDALSEVAITRLELLWRFDESAADAFTEHYRALTDIDLTGLPYWDLCAALRPAGVLGTWASTPAAEKRMRAKHSGFAGRAMTAISPRS